MADIHFGATPEYTKSPLHGPSTIRPSLALLEMEWRIFSVT